MDDPLDGLANERTLMAWVRTGLALIATGAITVRLPQPWPTAGNALGFGVIGLGGIVWAFGYTRYSAAMAALTTGRNVVSTGVIRMVAWGTSVVGLVALVLAVVAG